MELKTRNMISITSHSDCSMDYGVWTENSRGTYNKWDGVARCTTQVFLSWNLAPEAHILQLSSVFWYFVGLHSPQGIKKVVINWWKWTSQPKLVFPKWKATVFVHSIS